MNIVQRRCSKEVSASSSRAASPGRNIAGADGETMTGEPCANATQRLKLRVYAAAYKAILACIYG